MRKNLMTRWGMAIWTAGLAVILAAGCKKLAEHPQEHPEHPAPGGAPAEKAAKLSPEELLKEYPNAIQDYLEARKKEGRTLPVEDVHGKPVALDGPVRLVRIHTDKIVHYEGSTYFACSDFQTESGQRSYDLDFFMDKTPEGWRMKRLLLHKIDGKPQMTYKDNRPVPLGD